MGADSKPYARLRRALDAGQLPQAEAAARELDHLNLADSLGLVLLLLRERDARFEAAAVRWLGLLLTRRPHVRLEQAAQVADELAALGGASPDVARSRLAFVLRAAGEADAARVLEWGARAGRER